MSISRYLQTMPSGDLELPYQLVTKSYNHTFQTLTASTTGDYFSTAEKANQGGRNLSRYCEISLSRNFVIKYFLGYGLQRWQRLRQRSKNFYLPQEEFLQCDHIVLKHAQGSQIPHYPK